MKLRVRGRIGRIQAEPVAQNCRVNRGFAGIRIANRGVFGQLGKAEPGAVACDFQAISQLLAECRVKRSVDKVVRVLHADVPARVRKIARAQLGARCRRPTRQFHIQRLRRPATPRQRSSADRKHKPGIIERRMIDPGHSEVRRAAHEWQILDVLRQHERPGFEHQNAAAPGCVCSEQVFRDDAAKRAAADDNRVELPLATADGLSGAVEGFLQGVAQKPPHLV